MSNNTPTTQQEGAKQLVERSRAGDQNAMAILYKVGENARAGDPKAKQSYDLIMKYIKDHPNGSDPLILGAEAKQALGVLKDPSNDDPDIIDVLCSLPIIGNGLAIQTACILLGNGPAWTKARVKQVDSNIPGGEQDIFRFGYSDGVQSKQPLANKLPQKSVGYLCAGHCIGIARRIQLARLKQVPVSIISPEVGWELGC